MLRWIESLSCRYQDTKIGEFFLWFPRKKCIKSPCSKKKWSIWGVLKGEVHYTLYILRIFIIFLDRYIHIYSFICLLESKWLFEKRQGPGKISLWVDLGGAEKETLETDRSTQRWNGDQCDPSHQESQVRGRVARPIRVGHPDYLHGTHPVERDSW